MNAIKIEASVERDGELHLTGLPCRKGNRVEVIVLVTDERTEADREEALKRFLEGAGLRPFGPKAPTPRVTNCMNALDTNIWIYSHDTRDPGKQVAAQQLIATARPFVLLWQVGCEFMAASRKLRPQGFTQAQAWKALDDMQAAAANSTFPDASVWPAARDLQTRYSLSLWDALLVAACIRGGVQTLYTEDIGAPRVIDGLSLINPFLVGSAPAMPSP